MNDGNGQMLNSDGNEQRSVRVQLQRDGRSYTAFVSRQMADRLMQSKQNGTPVRVSANAKGVITAILNGQSLKVDQGRQRFRLHIDPLSFEPHIGVQWEDWLQLWTEDSEGPVWLLFYGSEGCGKDTLCRILIDRVMKNEGVDNVDIFTWPSEEEDRYVGHMETKGKELSEAVANSKRSGRTPIVYLSELAQLFGSGDFTSAWQTQFKAFFRGMLDGPEAFQADYLLATTNTLSGLGGPTISRAQAVHIKMSPEMAAGMLEKHWPADVLDDSSAEYVLYRLLHAPVAEGVRASCKTVSWKASDFTLFNGRFVKHFCADLRRNIQQRLRKDPDFIPDKAFLDKLLQEHLTAAVIAPVVEAAGTRTLKDFLVTPPSATDPIVEVKAVLQWADESAYLV